MEKNSKIKSKNKHIFIKSRKKIFEWRGYWFCRRDQRSQSEDLIRSVGEGFPADCRTDWNGS